MSAESILQPLSAIHGRALLKTLRFTPTLNHNDGHFSQWVFRPFGPFSSYRVQAHPEDGRISTIPTARGIPMPRGIPMTPGIPTASGYTTTSGYATFRYSRIQESEFRLIRILPRSTPAIECELVLRSRYHQYVAVSYAWGDSDDTKNILVNGSILAVTSSLYGVLGDIRSKGRDVLLWADALCINQRDKEEQSSQIQLMTDIYRQAEYVIVWLGPETEDSRLAVDLLEEVSKLAEQPEKMDRLITNKDRRAHFTALVHLFERDYWKRLWVVQEVLKAKSVMVYCGTRDISWETYTTASEVFKRHSGQLKSCFSSGKWVSQQRLPYTTVLSSLGPGSIHDLQLWEYTGARSLLKILRVCRRKHASEPRDKVFGILGILPETVRHYFVSRFAPNYNASLKEVYTNVVDFLLHTTGSLDVICEAIYYPVYTISANLPSWVPDWSHIPQTSALGLSYNFSASRNTNAVFRFQDRNRTKLVIAAVNIGRVHKLGTAVGTLCSLDDSLMAFLHWYGILSSYGLPSIQDRTIADEAFCQTLCLGQKTGWGSQEWVKACYHVFSSLIRERQSHIRLDKKLRQYARRDIGMSFEERRRILESNCSSRMMGRCFFVTDSGLIGMGTAFMNPGDMVCVPLGCSTPILLRPEPNDEYRYVGDVYVDRYMQGRAIDELDSGKGALREYVLR